MKRIVRWGVYLVGCCLIIEPAFAQEKASEPSTASLISPNDVEVKMIDGSTLRMTLLQERIDLATPFGKLTIPTREIRTIRFGTRLPPDTLQRIDSLTAQLGDKEFDKRELAQRELVRLKEFAYPAVMRAANDPDVELSRRAKKVVASLRESLPPEKLNIKQHDTVVTNEFTVTGKIEQPTFTAQTPFFGEMTLQVKQMNAMRWLASQTEVKITLDVAKCGGPGETWTETEIEFEAGSQLEVIATGTIDLNPTNGQPGTFLAEPGGPKTPNMQPHMNGRGQSFPPGALLGRVGASGTIFLVGAKYHQAVNQTGKLFLRVAANPWNTVPAGNYEIVATISLQ